MRPPPYFYEDHSEGHDLDYDHIDEMPLEQGYYDNGWQAVLIWCRTHNREEWHWVDYDKVPEHVTSRRAS